MSVEIAQPRRKSCDSVPSGDPALVQALPLRHLGVRNMEEEATLDAHAILKALNRDLDIAVPEVDTTSSDQTGIDPADQTDTDPEDQTDTDPEDQTGTDPAD